MSNGGFLSIGEFSKLTGIPRSKLIYYDEINLFPAAGRGENNYRYYSLNQITSIGFINDMSSFGMPLKDLLPLAQERSPESLLGVFKKATKQHRERIAHLRDTQGVMEVMDTLIQTGLRAKESEKDIEVLEYKPYHIILGSENTHQDATTFFPAWLTFISEAKKAGTNTKYPVGGYFESLERFCDNPSVPTRFYFVNPHGKDVRGGGKWLAGYTKGYYGQVSDLPERMTHYAEEHNFELTGPVYHTYLLDEMSLDDPEGYLARASVKIKEDAQDAG